MGVGVRGKEREVRPWDAVSLASNYGLTGALERRSRSVAAGKHACGVIRVHERLLNDERAVENEFCKNGHR